MMSDWRLTWSNRVIDQHAKVMRERQFDAPRRAESSFTEQYKSEIRRAKA
jgi:hypothetical protein